MSDVSNLGLRDFFATDHRDCDALWAAVETAADGGADAIAGAWNTFAAAMERHFRMEEEVMFPAFERATGMVGMGPTMVMRAEHEQMRGMLRTMAGCANSGDYEAMLDHGDTLLMLIQQHNVKEEGILYPMADQHLAGVWAELRAQLD